MLDRVQEQLTRRWERNQALVTHTRDRLAQYEAGLMDLREALNRAVGTTREAEELNSRNQERLEEALVESWPHPSSSLPPWTLHPITPTPLLSHLTSILLPPTVSLSSPATEAGAVRGQCHSGGYSAGCQRHPGPGL